MGAVDGELLAWRCRYMQKRGQVQCVRLLESRAKRGGVGGHFSGRVGHREGCFCAAGSVWLFFFAE